MDAPPSGAAYPALPGPVDRESFLDAQRRHRRASWWFTLWSGMAILLTGIPLSAVLTPLVYMAAFLGVDVVNLVHPVGDVARGLGNGNSSSSSTPVHWTPALVAVVAASLIIPGAVVLLGAWLAVRRLFRHAGAGAGVLHLGARDPRTGDLEEHQLVNVVAEMAAAAGVPPPAVKLIDSDIANAGVIGGTLDDATVVVTTGLLAHLDRDETQAVVGHLVGSAGNGDLHIGTTILSVYQTFGLVSAFLGAPLDRRSRHTVWRVLRSMFSRGRPQVDDLGDVLAAADPELGESNKSPGLLSILTLPFLMASGAFMMTRMIFTWLLVNPFLKRGWRARKELADASAVELTRNPSALSRALATLTGYGGLVPGAGWAAHLFVVGPEVHAELVQHQVEEQAAAIRAHPEVAFSERLRQAQELAAARRAAGATSTSPTPSTSSSAEQPAVADFLPRLSRRIAHLRRLGADPGIEVVGPRRRSGCATAFLVVLAPLWIALCAVLLGCALALIGIAFAIDAIYLGMVIVPLHLLLRSFGH